jgi:hypothetical protein
MGNRTGDNSADPEFREYVPKRYREHLSTAGSQQPPYVASGPTVPLSMEAHRARRAAHESSLWPDPIPEPLVEQEDGFLAMIGRVGLVAGFAALIALSVVFGKPLLEPILDVVRPLLYSNSQSQQVAKVTERLAANNAQTTRAVVPSTAVVAAPTVVPAPNVQVRQAPTAQQASLTPMGGPIRWSRQRTRAKHETRH